jgi:hypothetical protein
MNDIEFHNDFVPHLNAPARFVPTHSLGTKRGCQNRLFKPANRENAKTN